ncbi:MAG: carboxypeptidase-like regulatory domain-containing protein [Acidobacteriia bacterium]|nr:carboxypeptidase-like regulatory domain-containing protein [Terriglobia bacterium]
MSKASVPQAANGQHDVSIFLGWRWLAVLVVITGWTGWSPAVLAQSLNAAGGTSSFLQASGFQVDYQWQPVSGWMGLAAADGLHVGGFLGTTYRGFDLGAGDRYYPFVLDTDVFDQSYIFYGRGLSVGHHSANERWTLFGGTTALPFTTPFLRAYETDTAAGAFFYERRLSSRLVFHSFNILGNTTTSIHSLGFKLKPHWNVAAATGVGAGSRFFSAATQYKYRWLAVTGSYTDNGERFHRLRVMNLLYPERTGGNVRVQLTPLSRLGLQLNHETVLSPQLNSPTSLRATLNSASLFTSLGGFSMNAGVSQSTGGGFFTNTQMFTVNRKLGSRLATFGAIIRVRTQNSKPANLFLLTAEERLTRRLSVRQTLTDSAGSKTMGWGGRFLSNPFTLGLDYQTVFNPLAGGFGGRTFVQAWTVNLQVQMPRGISLHYDTFLDPFGKFRYTAFVNGISYSPVEQILVSPASSQTTLSRYLIRGVVQDERGQPVWGIAVQVDGQYVYSDNQGEFFLRVSRAGDYSLRVLSDRSLNPGQWEIVHAPSSVLAGPPKDARAAVIVVRRGAPKLQR